MFFRSGISFILPFRSKPIINFIKQLDNIGIYIKVHFEYGIQSPLLVDNLYQIQSIPSLFMCNFRYEVAPPLMSAQHRAMYQIRLFRTL